MIEAPMPTRAEVNDIFNTLADGADGLVLAAETAIGVNPVACANMVVRLVREFRRPDFPPTTYAPGDTSLLVEPHGGTLVDRVAPADAREDISGLPVLRVDSEDLIDAEQIAFGTFSPLTGFMGSKALSAVLEDYRLPDGTVWPLPIVLRVAPEDARALGGADRVVLAGSDGVPHSVLDVFEIYEIDPDAIAERWFGTSSTAHPGVDWLARGPHTAIAGDVTLLSRMRPDNARYDLAPSQLRFIFAHKGWSRVVGFHTRNVAHRAHEYIQLEALRRTFADGLFISPVVGRRKVGDFLASTVLDSYQSLIDSGIYPEGRVLLSSFRTYARYAGPREAVFTALCRKNMGCSHIVIGRDHTGVGDFYAPDASQELFERLGDIGIRPVVFDAVGYDSEAKEFVEGSSGAAVEKISATRVRDLLAGGRPVPEWLLRPEVLQALRQRSAAGLPLVQD
jgi:ATP sulfurylase